MDAKGVPDLSRPRALLHPSGQGCFLAMGLWPPAARASSAELLRPAPRLLRRTACASAALMAPALHPLVGRLLLRFHLLQSASLPSLRWEKFLLPGLGFYYGSESMLDKNKRMTPV